jgi:plastocyanin
MWTPRLAAAAVVSLALVPFGGCGGSDDATSTSRTGPCRTLTVSVGDFTYSPADVEVHPCDAVVWKNAHDQAHTSTGQGAQTWNTGTIEPGRTSTPVSFDDRGSFTYICALHPFMHGEVHVG